MSRSHQRRPQKSGGHHQPRRGPIQQPELLAMAREAARSGNPLDLLVLGSTLLSVIDPRRRPLDRAPVDRSAPADLIAALGKSPDPAAVLLALIIAHLAGDQSAVEQILGRPRPLDRELPTWAVSLGNVKVTDSLLVTEALGDAESLLIRVVTGGGYEFAFSVLVDHNLRGTLKDAYPLDTEWKRVRPIYHRFSKDPDVEASLLSPADACARIAEANAHGDRMYPPLDSITWPAAQPLLEWALRHGPSGGSGYSYPEWDEEGREEIKASFLATPYAAGFEAEDVSLLETILWFATDYGPSDPYRWSPTSVEIFLLDWLPRKIMAAVDYLDRAPRVLDSFVRYCHAARGVRPGLTTQTVAAIDSFTFEYRLLIRSDRPQGPQALLAQAGWYHHEPKPSGGEYDWQRELTLMARQQLAHQVGGYHVLADLNVFPLIATADPWEGIDEGVRPTVDLIDDLCQRCARELFDEELAIATRQFLADVALADPRVLLRGRPEVAAAAISWIVGRANDVLGPHRGMPVKDLLAWFGVNRSVSSRAEPVLRALGKDPFDLSSHNSLGTARYLTSTRRRAILSRWRELEARAQR